jgi:hypothetical protein
VHMTSCRMLWAYELSDKIVIPYWFQLLQS